MNIYMIRFMTKTGAESFLMKTEPIHERRDLDEVRYILGILEDAGEIRDTHVLLVNAEAAVTPGEWKSEMEKKFGSVEKGRPDMTRIDERMDPETEKMVRNLLVGAFEGGSNHWYRIESEKLPKGTTKKDFKQGGRMQPEGDYFHPLELIPTYPGGQIVIREIGGGDGEAYVLDLGALKKGLMLLREKYPVVWRRVTEGMEDADDADIFLQLAVFGEVIIG